VEVGAEDGVVYVRGRLDGRRFRRYVETCRKLGLKFRDGRWVKERQRNPPPFNI